MNFLIIILAIIIILLGYYIYTIVSAPPSLVKNVDLSEPAVAIANTAIKNPYSANYTIGVWVYITNYSQNGQIDRFLMYGDANYKGPSSLFSLRMDKNAPILYCDILVSKDGSKVPSVQSIPITSAVNPFPIQKWTYVVVSVSNPYIESYINGRFIRADQISGTIFVANTPSDPASTATFNFGAKGTKMDDGSVRQTGCPVILNGLARWDSPLSAGDIYNNYNKGNGMSSGVFGPAYHLDINLKQDSKNYVLPVF
jgi:Concanavalin A-like lectin/glucanases superfamily